MLQNKRILLIISGGIAAYKSLELIRLLKKDGAQVRCILTKGGAQFVTPLSVAALSEEKVYTDLWSLTDETEMGHIRLSREADLILVAPASADLLAKMVHGLADDLASTTLLAANAPIMVAPAMNPMMWQNAATQQNIETLKARGISIIGPDTGDMACGENGLGRLLEPLDIRKAIHGFFFDLPLKGLRALVTSGPTFEPIDPVRFIGNRSSGKQGHAIATALAAAGADVTLVTGPVSLQDPVSAKTVHVETAEQMLQACIAALPCDIAVCAAAVSDWRAAETKQHKIKKRSNARPPVLDLEETTDILKAISQHKKYRPSLVIGFAAETQSVQENAAAKLSSKGCDWILANSVADNAGFGQNDNTVSLIRTSGAEQWQTMSKQAVAQKLTAGIIRHFKS